MKKRMVKILFVVLTFCIPFLYLNNAVAYEAITAQEAYEIMLADENASMLDVRSLEELHWVGSPAFEPGGPPVSYVVPWMFFDIDHAGNLVKSTNEDFLEIVTNFFNTDDVLILFCRSGGRSSSAAEMLETAGYVNVYEIDNYMDDGGRGGFQGSGYSNSYDGYRGYPERLPSNMAPHKIKIKFDSNRITNPDDSVSWMDSGLPITQKIDKDLILTLP